MRRLAGLGFLVAGIGCEAPADGEPGALGRAPWRRDVVTLPAEADGPIVIEGQSGMEARIQLLGARSVAAVVTERGARYPDALGAGASLEVRVLETGFEDFVVLPAPPPSGAVSYRVGLGAVAGLRLVGGALELLDDGGAPRLRMAPPFAIDREGRRHRLPVRVQGCAVDTSPRLPWGRPAIPPGASNCEVVVELSRVGSYPLTVDPAWTTTSSTAEPRAEHAAVLLASGRALVAGRSETGFVDAEVFDPATATFAVTSPMLEARARPALAPLGTGSTVLAIGGAEPCDGCAALASVELFDEVTGLFTAFPSMSTARVEHAAARLADGRVLGVGGNAGTPGSPHLATSDIFDPSTGEFTPGPSLTVARSGHTLTPLAEGSALVAGGAPGPKLTERYVAASNTFVAAGNLTDRRTDHDAALLTDGRVLVAGGRVPSSIDNVLAAEVFDPAAPVESAWGPAGELGAPHPFGSLTALSGGRAIIAGGCCVTASAELFDPARGSWIATTSLQAARSGHAATALSDTTILVVGGSDTGGPLASAEMFTLSVPGDPCETGLTCGSGFCVDGVCCDTPCEASCEGCSAAAKGGGASGTCGWVADGLSDPKGVCAPSPGACGASGLCGAAGACQPPPTGAPCGELECPLGAGVCTAAGTCACAPIECDPDGLTLGDVDCAPYRCREGACLDDCRTSSECAPGFVCNDDRRCTTAPLPPPDAGCACEAAPGAPGSSLGSLVLAGAALLRARRRRR